MKTKNFESGRSTPICHCETAQTKNNPANCFCAQSNETQKAKRQCGRIDVGIGATWQSDEIASHSFAMTEYGRSMVEMLGVLAVIGVLSVAGIAGYHNAMNRYRANEILNEVQKRAVVATMQLAAGRKISEVSLAEFGNSPFKNTLGEATNIKQFNIELLSAPSANICSFMKNLIGKSTPIRAIDETCTQFTFNPDLSTNDNVDVGSCEAPDTIYLSYNTDPCTTTINQDVSCTKNEDCGNPNWGACCVDGKCRAGSGSSHCENLQGKCVKNSDCENGYFCNVMSGTFLPQQGSCVPLTTAIPRPASDITIAEIDYKAKKFIMYSNAISYWGAQNWCAAHGMRMATLADLGLKVPENDEQIPENMDGHVFTNEERNQFKNAFNCCFWVSDHHTNLNFAYAVYDTKVYEWQKRTGMRPLCIKD